MDAVGDLYQQAGIWPARVRLPDAEGLTLWARGEPGGGCALVVGEAFALFRDGATLARFVAAGSGGSFRARPGFALLRDHVGESVEPAVAVDYCELAAALDRPAAAWTLAELGDVCAGLDLLADVVASLPGTGLDRLFREPELVSLRAHLGGVGEDGLREAASRLRSPALRTAIGGSLVVLGRRTVLDPA